VDSVQGIARSSRSGNLRYGQPADSAQLFSEWALSADGEFLPATYQVRVALDCRAGTETACSLTMGPTVTGDFGGDGESEIFARPASF
jgi:hypothetical protein